MKKVLIDEFIEFNEERFTKRVIFKEDESTVFVLNFKQGQTLPTHKHLGTNVYLLVLDGEGSLIINGEKHTIKKNESILCNGEDEFAFENDGPSNVSLYVMLNKIPDKRYSEDI
ncbi:cupin domain-containing protein [Litchfieldia salsa]|uniref:Cupin domain protein n=1 Tax=Litchfieldia salsa TaxID=930152 RepID=A0A1H0WT85_9BACI|nr:cupin domain-containing protein [Litchfieldia salsa]SDP93917.1 Cupin domain protein [Litchfieldia salsa]